ncbi:MAG TPA: gliding motility-associated C-terminal domain-containing protein, partial [Saprospiraceae bacterium]|nr:gliding motility-associated C-terminal domain-containing protein [Saprospiraceae bacterium]
PDITDFKLWIYDRWGELVFNSHDPQFEWDGTFHGKKLLPGVYAYVLEYTMNGLGSSRQKLIGDITLVR